MINLRDYQEKIINDVKIALKLGYHAPLVVSPTGSGKTAIFAAIAQSAEKKGNRVLILVHRREILTQTIRSLYRLEVVAGQVKSGSKITTNLIQVAMVGTVVNKLDMIRKPKLIIIDECHHSVAGQWQSVLDYFPDVPRVGFTATPQRMDGRGLDDIFDYMIRGPEIMHLVGQGFLSPPIMFAAEKEITEQFKITRGDFDKKEQEGVLSKRQIVGDVIQEYRDKLNGLPTVCFCVSIAHSELMAQAFCDAGYNAVSVSGKMNDSDRDDAINGLAIGKYNVVCSCDVISEGVDVPVMVGAILLRRTMSLSLYLQQVGRALRVAQGKDRAIIIDHAGNYHIHGHVLKNRDWTLEGRKKGQRQKQDNPNYTRCPECLAVWPGEPKKCPNCGASLIEEQHKSKGLKLPEEIEGELIEVLDNEDEAQAMSRFLYQIQQLPPAIKQKAALKKCYEMRDPIKIKALGEILGYKPGWDKWAWERVKNTVTA